MTKDMDVAEAKEGRLMELDIRNARMSQEKVDALKRNGQETVPSAHFHAPREKRRTTSATLKDQDSRPGSESSVTSIRGRVQTGLLPTPAEFEMKWAKKVGEDAKILAPKSIMPETLFGEASVLRGRSFNLHAYLRTAIINYLDDKEPASMTKQGPPRLKNEHGSDFEHKEIEGEPREDEETKNEVIQDEVFAMVQQYRKGKGKVQGKGKQVKHVGTVVKVITTAEIARKTNKTTAGQLAVHGRIRKAARQAKMQAKDGTQARAIGTAGEAVRAKAKTGTGMASPKNGKARTDRMMGARQHGKARAARKGSSKGSIHSVREASDIDGWTQSDGSQSSSRTRRRNSLLHAERQQSAESTM